MAKKIIIAEDSAPNLKILQLLLTKAGAEVIACTDGEEAVSAIDANNPAEVMAIVSDYMMPGKNGIEVLCHARSRDGWQETPFYMLTALADKEVVKEAKENGITGFLQKPVSKEKVDALIKKHMK